MGGKNTRGKNKQHQSGNRERETVAIRDLVLKEKSPIPIFILFPCLVLLWDEWNLHVQKAACLAFCVL